MKPNCLQRVLVLGAIAAAVAALAGAASAAAKYTVTDLGTLGGSFSRGSAIDDAGVVAGSSAAPDGQPHGFVFSGGVLSDIGTLGGTYSFANAIDDGGQVTGTSQTPFG